MPIAARPGPPPRTEPPSIWERALQAGRHELEATYAAVTNPAQAAADYLREQRKYGRFADVVGGAEAGVGARLINGYGAAAYYARRFLPGQTGLIDDAFAERGLLPPPPDPRVAMRRAAEPLRREAVARPPTKTWEKVVAAIPNIAAMVAAPPAAPALLGLEGLGEASESAHRSGRAGPLTDLGVMATGGLDAALGGLQVSALRGPVVDAALQALPQTLRAVQIPLRTAAKATISAGLAAAQRAGENSLARLSYDPDRQPSDGVGDSALVSGLLAAPFGALGGRSSVRPGSQVEDWSLGNRKTVSANQAAGAAWEAEVMAGHLPQLQHSIRPQLTIRSGGPSGLKVRVDAVGTDVDNGSLRLSDMKASETAPFTRNQRTVYPELKTHGGTIAGKGKNPYVGGMQIAPTEVDIIRKPRS